MKKPPIILHKNPLFWRETTSYIEIFMLKFQIDRALPNNI